VEVFLPLVLEK